MKNGMLEGGLQSVPPGKRFCFIKCLRFLIIFYVLSNVNFGFFVTGKCAIKTKIYSRK